MDESGPRPVLVVGALARRRRLLRALADARIVAVGVRTFERAVSLLAGGDLRPAAIVMDAGPKPRLELAAVARTSGYPLLVEVGGRRAPRLVLTVRLPGPMEPLRVVEAVRGLAASQGRARPCLR